MPDIPLNELVSQCEEVINLGGMIFVKWTCDGCGSRQTMSEPNIIYKYGRCEECGDTTDISKKGGGFMVVFSKRF